MASVKRLIKEDPRITQKEIKDRLNLPSGSLDRILISIIIKKHSISPYREALPNRWSRSYSGQERKTVNAEWYIIIINTCLHAQGYQGPEGTPCTHGTCGLLLHHSSEGQWLTTRRVATSRTAVPSFSHDSAERSCQRLSYKSPNLQKLRNNCSPVSKAHNELCLEMKWLSRTISQLSLGIHLLYQLDAFKMDCFPPVIFAVLCSMITCDKAEGLS